MTALHLGCGLDYCPGAINVDRHDLTAADLQADALRLPLAAGSASRVEARQLVEHLGYAGTVYALAEWLRVLGAGGSLLIETPDRPAACRAAAGPNPPAPALHWLFGLPGPGYSHLTLFAEAELHALAQESGFSRIEIVRLDTPQPTLRLSACKSADPRADLRSRLHTGFVAAGIVDPITAPPHLARLETICDQVVAAAAALSQEDVPASIACLDTVLGTTARYDPRLALVAVQVLASLGLVDEVTALLYLALAQTLIDGAFPARLAAYLRHSPAPPGTQAVRLQRLHERASLYLTARLYPGEIALQQVREDFEAATANPTPADQEITFFCAETVTGLSRQQTARGVSAFARNAHDIAHDLFEVAVAYDADNPLPVWNLARLAWLQGRRLDALVHYAALLELLPDAGDALRAELDAVTGDGRQPPARFVGPVGGELIP